MSEYGEPWTKATVYSIEDCHGATVLQEVYGDCSGAFEHIIGRIVACVNACAGIPTEELQKLNPGVLKECLARLPVADWLR